MLHALYYLFNVISINYLQLNLANKSTSKMESFDFFPPEI